MPDLDLIPVPLFDGSEPYHWTYDNVPLTALKARQDILSDAVDTNTGLLQDAAGTQGTLVTRLNRSTNADGSLKGSAVDSSLHNIGSHADGSATVDSGTLSGLSSLGYTGLSNPVPFVRMLAAERTKLASMSVGATSLSIRVVGADEPSGVLFDANTITIEDSDTVTWAVSGQNILQAAVAFPVNAAHEHFYDQQAIPTNVGNPDYTNYKVNSSSQPQFIEGSLRVHVNGVRLSQAVSVYVPPADMTSASPTWTLTSYDESSSDGTFSLSRPVTSADSVRIDYDLVYT